MSLKTKFGHFLMPDDGANTNTGASPAAPEPQQQAQPAAKPQPATSTGQDVIAGDKGAPVVSRSLDDEPPNFDNLGKKEDLDDSKKKPAAVVEPEKKETKEQESKESTEKKTETKNVIEAKKEEAKKPIEEEVPESDTDIDSLQPDPQMSQSNLANFEKVRTTLKKERDGRRALASQIKTLRQELEETTKKVSSSLTPEVEAELTDLRKMRQRVLRTEDPALQSEFTGRLSKVQESIVKDLKENGLGEKWSEDRQKEFFEKELWENGPDFWKQTLDALAGDPIGQERLKRSLLERQDIFKERDERIKQIEADTEGYDKQREETTKKQYEEFVSKVQEAIQPLQDKNEWAATKPVPENASEAEKKNIEAHNRAVQEEVKRFNETFMAVNNRDPKAIGETLFRAFEATHLRKQVESLTAERDAEKKRADDAEEMIAASRQAGELPRENRAPIAQPERKLGKNEPYLGGSSKDTPADFSQLRVTR